MLTSASDFKSGVRKVGVYLVYESWFKKEKEQWLSQDSVNTGLYLITLKKHGQYLKKTTNKKFIIGYSFIGRFKRERGVVTGVATPPSPNIKFQK